ncbi:sigma factor [Ammoniphilus resinae]|uniref:DNA-directed RNA polymerase specialized sigma24 family protein n=1 Tax=Ammoniphilus resinae TaxID=861532 RepID=A0ABS4GW87_9BACL|nr:sigma factor [Ammoniphilus resinae]MBP1934531.1 DNA-directed RNA polymerase specialized sigma24 family protein [Ammoniphilus resinae]
MEQLEDLLKEKGKIIYRYLRKMGSAHDDAQDIVQDTLYKAILILHDLDSARLNPWLFRVAYNQYIDLTRKRKRWGEIPMDTVDLIGKMDQVERLYRQEWRD